MTLYFENHFHYLSSSPLYMKLCKTLTELCKNKGELQETYTNKAPDFCSSTSLKEAFHFTEEIFHFWKKFFSCLYM